MRRVQRLGLTLVGTAGAVLLTGGCASIRDHRGYLSDRVLVDSVQPGVDNRQSVERTLGHPTFASQFGQKDWYYVSIATKQAPFTRPRTESEQVMRISFDAAGNVAKIEKFGKEQVVRLSPNGDATPTLGRTRGFLEDMFGNIGAVGAAGAGGGTGSQGGPGGGPNGS